jgi:hypothetical protein
MEETAVRTGRLTERHGQRRAEVYGFLGPAGLALLSALTP